MADEEQGGDPAATPTLSPSPAAAPDSVPASAPSTSPPTSAPSATPPTEDAPPSATPTRLARALDRITYLFLHRGSALLYQLTMAITLGTLLGTVIALVLFGEKNLEILIGGVGGIAVVSALLRWVVASVPELDDRSRELSAKRRVFMLTVIMTGVAFYGHFWTIKSGFPLIPLGQDTELYRRINRLEDQVKQVEADLGTVPMHRHSLTSAPQLRTWRRVPVKPGKPYNLRLETGDTSRDVWVELVVTDEKGKILGARRALSSRDLRLTVLTEDHWSIGVGVRWWPRGTGPLDLTTSDPPKPPLELQLTATEAQEGRITSAWSRELSSLDFDGKELSASGDSSESLRDTLRSRCGGDGSNELLYRLDLSDAPTGGWLALGAQSELTMATILGLYAEDGRSADEEGEETLRIRELACDGSAFLFEGNVDTLRRDNLTSTLHVAIPPGVYYVAIDGLPAPRRRERALALPFTLRGTFTPFDAASPLQIDSHAPASTHLVDLVHARSVETCEQRDITYIDLPVRIDSGQRSVTASLSSEGPNAPSGLVWLPDDPAERGCDLYDRAESRPYVAFGDDEAKTIRLFRPAPNRQPAIESLSFRVDTPATDALKAACREAPVLVESIPGSYFGQTGSGASPIVGLDSEALPKDDYTQPRVFAVTACAANARWQPPRTDGPSPAKTSINPFDYAPGEDTTESIWTFTLTETSAVDLMVASSVSGALLYTSIIRECESIPEVVACEQARGPEKVTRRIRLPAGTYQVIADGPGTHFLALGVNPVQNDPDDPLDPRNDPLGD